MFFQVSKLGHYSEEIRRSLSEILLSVMNILLQKYKNIQSNNKRNVADQESFFYRRTFHRFPFFLGDFRSSTARLSSKMSPTENENTVCTFSQAILNNSESSVLYILSHLIYLARIESLTEGSKIIKILLVEIYRLYFSSLMM